MTDSELHLFFEDFVRTLRSRGVVCAITSGMACVHYGVAETTQDCDLLCHTNSFQALMDLLAETNVSGQPCHYRGNISPPLDARWHRGGWTSHFQWGTQPEVTTLDVFGHALRESSPWEDDIAGLYAGEHIVAQMRCTDSDSDWTIVTLHGISLLRLGDSRGWLHSYDAEVLLAMQEVCPIPDEMLAVRPALQLAVRRDPRLHQALLAERHFWQELDRLRIRIYRAALRPYVVAIGRAGICPQADLRQQHEARVAVASKTLEKNPVGKHGVDRMIEEARQSTAAFVHPELIQWLPDVRPHFSILAA